ncbi:hypothetical protein [Neobacillus dielmonensis]|uniref:hypothetical protein n=1 Tax=Neobacillus dielmonensis TaxID=1347369 RepID=UPI000AE6B411|nr:hypothetical protein [Neobacillus dielmonensis]
MGISRKMEVESVLASLDHPLANKWLYNDLIKRSIAVSYDYWLEDTGIPMSLEEFVQQYLEHASYLGGIFTADLEEPG